MKKIIDKQFPKIKQTALSIREGDIITVIHVAKFAHQFSLLMFCSR